MPSGNGAAAVLFDRLFRLTGKGCGALLPRRSGLHLRSAGQYPAGCCYALTAMLTSGASRELVCVTPEETLPEALKAVLSRYAPELTVLVKDACKRCRARGCRAPPRTCSPRTADPRIMSVPAAAAPCRWIWDKNGLSRF